jgi:hypothetical protein
LSDTEQHSDDLCGNMLVGDRSGSGIPFLIYEQQTGNEARYVYYGETQRGPLRAMVVTERDDKIRVITAYDLDRAETRLLGTVCTRRVI